MGLLYTFKLLPTLAQVNSSSNSNSNQLEQLKCVVYYYNALVVGQKKGVINYKSTNGIFALCKHLETNHHQL